MKWLLCERVCPTPTIPSALLMQYYATIGLSGSLGSPSEKDFLSTTYGAEFLDVPPFLDTCAGARKHPPTLLGDSVSVFITPREQYTAVARLALAQCTRVPVVVIAKNSIAAAAIFAEVRAQAAEALGNPAAADSVAQLFVEATEGQRSVVERATVPFERAPYDFVWRITVTEYWGGRGQDYRVNNDDVDTAGGLLVIMTEIPVSEREWVQWKGRTARNDRRGQYAVMLCADDEPCKSSAATLAEHRVQVSTVAAPAPGAVPQPQQPVLASFRPPLVHALLRVRDEEQRAKLAGLGPDIARGQQLAELCDKFYAQHADKKGGWPANEPQRRLRDFLREEKSNMTAGKIAAFAASVGLSMDAAAYLAKSQYAQ
jgi:hypothetical protein